MAKGPRYSVKFRRRREGKTDYQKRVNYLKSKKTRLVVRRSNKYITAQVVQYSTKGDKTLALVSSKNLEKLGWSYSRKNIPAAYLTGLLLGKKAEVKEAILDIGELHTREGTRIYAVAKGFKDAGIKLSCDEKMFPKEERLQGKHISDKIAKKFEEVKKKILAKK
ncbi:MAG: 50S ribosomal protein L18 [Candidatus Woesearchaeota archaeon]|nr:MAG: 50S ribosomal protein L18 [Candidatus Woesearchaeota archaeon]